MFPTAGFEASPEVVSDSPHLVETHRSLIGHFSGDLADSVAGSGDNASTDDSETGNNATPTTDATGTAGTDG